MEELRQWYAHVVYMCKFICFTSCFLGTSLCFAQAVKPSDVPPKRVLIYSEQISSTKEQSRSWPTVNIWRKVDSAAPERLAQIGRVGEYPGRYSLRPDRKQLLINLESKLQALDLESKRLEDIFTPIREALSAVYSPDGSEALVWDQMYVPKDGNNRYYVHRISPATRKLELLMQGASETTFFLEAWRDDGNVVLYENHYSYSVPYSLSLSRRSMARTPGDHVSGVVGANGKLMAVEEAKVEDPCEAMDGSSPDTYAIIDPVSGARKGRVVAKGKRVQILAFSASGKEVFYGTEAIPSDDSLCEKAPVTAYYKAPLSGRPATRVSGPLGLPRGWNDFYFGAVVHKDQKNGKWIISVAGRPMVVSEKPLGLIAQYYE